MNLIKVKSSHPPQVSRGVEIFRRRSLNVIGVRRIRMAVFCERIVLSSYVEIVESVCQAAISVQIGKLVYFQKHSIKWEKTEIYPSVKCGVRWLNL